jgi:hypothetical protein
MKMLVGIVCCIRGSALRSIYLACVRTVTKYRCELWLCGDGSQIRTWSPFSMKISRNSKKELKPTKVLPLRNRLEHVFALELTRIFFRVDHENCDEGRLNYCTNKYVYCTNI